MSNLSASAESRTMADAASPKVVFDPAASSVRTLTWLVAFEPALRAFIERRLPQSTAIPWDADDVLQETCSAALKRPACLHCRRLQDFRAVLYSIASNKLIDLIRYTEAQKRGEGGTSVSTIGSETDAPKIPYAKTPRTPSTTYSGIELKAILARAMSQLPKDQRTAFEMRFTDDDKPAEVAKRMGRSVASVKNLIGRAQRKLAQILGGRSRFM